MVHDYSREGRTGTVVETDGGCVVGKHVPRIFVSLSYVVFPSCPPPLTSKPAQNA